MELKLETKSMISSVLYTRLLEMWTNNKSLKQRLLSKIPSEKDLNEYVFSIEHYGDVRQAYIEFCDECDFDVNLQFEYPEIHAAVTQNTETSDICLGQEELEINDRPFQEDEE